MRRIEEYRRVQTVFMPETIAAFRAKCRDGNGPANSNVDPLSIPLLLPSAACRDCSVPGVLLEIEFCLRKAQAYDALADLRDYLEVLDYMRGHLDGDGESADVRDGLSMFACLVDSHIRLAVDRYRSAYAALGELAGALRKEHWQDSLQRLDDEHVQCLLDESLETATTPRVRSWIWQLSGTPFVRPHNARNPYVSITLHHGE